MGVTIKLDTLDPVKIGTVIIDQINRELATAGEALVAQIQVNIRADDASASGGAGMIGSFTSTGVPIPGGVTAIRVGSPLSYPGYVEMGTRPHWMPIAPLLLWAEKKIQPHVLAVGVSFESGRAAPASKGTRILKGDARTRAIRAVAYAVQHAIAKRGTRARYFMAHALEALGMEWTLRVDATEMVYDVDVVKYLEGRDIWEKVKGRLVA